uniref:Uncharacterized protein n=1 Tax=Clytia hemisphaerica TaxID=252671 RepID=A0A7M5X4G3_9CNID
MIMEDHKWGFALEEAVKELETEYTKKEQKSKKPKHKKWGIIRRITGGGKKKAVKNEEESAEEKTPEHVKSDLPKQENENNNVEETVEDKKEELCHSPIVDLKQSCSSPIMSGNYPDRRKRTPRKTGVAERNETERQVVYRTLKNYNQINKLHDYDLV